MLAARRRASGWTARIASWFRRAPRTDKLYILRIDFPLKPESEQKIDEALELLRKKYGLDFFVMQPGMSLSRFDDI
jgi:hypothetical protein